MAQINCTPERNLNNANVDDTSLFVVPSPHTGEFENTHTSILLPSFSHDVLQQLRESVTGAILELKAYMDSNRELISSISNTMMEIAKCYQEWTSALIRSPFFEWIYDLDFGSLKPLLEALENAHELHEQSKDIENAFLSTMMECHWFPYAAWTADISVLADLCIILSSSRGASKRREQRIDRAIIAYYSSDKLLDMKISWKKSNMENHIKRILCEALDAHIRGEYALTIAVLATMWEGIIYQKACSDPVTCRQRRKMEKTKQDLATLTQANDYSSIFSDYFNTFIVSQCNSEGDVLQGVPNRHGVLHGWYPRYPNKKASLNAILLTDFLLNLTPSPLSESELPTQQE